MANDNQLNPEALAVSTVDKERKIVATSSHRSLADRLAASPKSPHDWPRDDDALLETAFDREVL